MPSAMDVAREMLEGESEGLYTGAQDFERTRVSVRRHAGTVRVRVKSRATVG